MSGSLWKIIKSTLFIFAIAIALGLITALNSKLGILVSGLLSALAIFAFFKPIPKLFLSGKVFLSCLLLFATLPAISLALNPPQGMGDQYEIAEASKTSGEHTGERIKVQKEATAEPVKPDTKKRPYAQKTKYMAKQIVDIFKTTYKVTTQPEIPNTPICREDGYCAIKVENIIIRVFGAGLVAVQTPEPQFLSTYREVCSAVYSAISGQDLDYSAVLLDKSFQHASVTGSFKRALNNVEIKITPDSGGVLECQFFKYGN